ILRAARDDRGARNEDEGGKRTSKSKLHNNETCEPLGGKRCHGCFYDGVPDLVHVSSEAAAAAQRDPSRESRFAKLRAGCGGFAGARGCWRWSQARCRSSFS